TVVPSFARSLPAICAAAYWRHSPSSARNWSKLLVLPGRTITLGPPGIAVHPATSSAAAPKSVFLNSDPTAPRARPGVPVQRAAREREAAQARRTAERGAGPARAVDRPVLKRERRKPRARAALARRASSPRRTL